MFIKVVSFLINDNSSTMIKSLNSIFKILFFSRDFEMMNEDYDYDKEVERAKAAAPKAPKKSKKKDKRPEPEPEVDDDDRDYRNEL